MDSPAAEPSAAPAPAPSDQLVNLTTSASHQYALKNYDAAADLYSQATALQAELNGEMDPQNADLLYAYGRCLYHVAVANSDVLGGKVAGETPQNKAGGKKRKRADGAGSAAATEAVNTSSGGIIAQAMMEGSAKTHEQASTDAVAGEIAEKAVENKDGMVVKEEERRAKQAAKPFFQISGDDEEWSEGDSDEEKNAGDGEDGEDASGDGDDDDEETDDFATAFEILDVARVLLTRHIEELGSSDQNEAVKSKIHQARERLADTHDLQAEISLENERFNDAVLDARASLALKKELYPIGAAVVAEAHFKLSLALEFASVTTPAPTVTDATASAQESSSSKLPAPNTDAQNQTVDLALREEAAVEMGEAIKSSQVRISNEEQLLAEKEAMLKTAQAEDDTAANDIRIEIDTIRKRVAEIKEIVQDMELRLADLRAPLAPAGSASAAANSAEANAVSGVLGSILGESPAAQRERLEEAMKGAKDVSNLVRKGGKGKGKRTASVSGDKSEDKRARVEDQEGQ